MGVNLCPPNFELWASLIFEANGFFFYPTDLLQKTDILRLTISHENYTFWPIFRPGMNFVTLDLVVSSTCEGGKSKMQIKPKNVKSHLNWVFELGISEKTPL